MAEAAGWTPEDSQAFNSYEHSGHRAAHDKWYDMNNEAMDKGTATELPNPELVRNEMMLRDKVAQLEVEQQEYLANGEDHGRLLTPEQRLAAKSSELRESRRLLERARHWTTVLQQARERGVEIPVHFSRAEGCMHIEKSLSEKQRRIAAYELGVMEFRGADEDKDAEAVREALKRFPEVEDIGMGWRLKIDWGSIRNLADRLQEYPEGEQVQAVLRKSRLDDIYVADIEDYRDLVEINDILLPLRRQWSEKIAAELDEFKQKIGFLDA